MTEDKWIRTPADQSCPDCKFPEITAERNMRTGQRKNWKCRKCGWKKK